MPTSQQAPFPFTSPAPPVRLPADGDSRLADDDALLRLVACGGALEPRRRLLSNAAPSLALERGEPFWRACGLERNQIAVLRSPPSDALVRAREWLARPGHHVIGWNGSDYPTLLANSPNPPLALFVAGDPSLLWRPGIAVVGSRSPSPGGRDNAARFACALSGSGLLVASGLAAGVDTAAHQAVLDAGAPTVAVLGTGPDVPYPRSNARLHEAVIAHGAVVSEYLPGTQARKAHFPSRNRILAGLTLGTLVVEAAMRSGALITARLAGECGREVMALPGSIHNPVARGCHRLIREGAALVETPEEVLQLLLPASQHLASDLRRALSIPTSPPDATPLSPRGRPGIRGRPPALPPPAATADFPEPPPPLDADHQKLWSALGHDPTDMDQLVARTGLTPAQLSSMLLPMELEGRVTAQHGRYFRNR